MWAGIVALVAAVAVARFPVHPWMDRARAIVGAQRGHLGENPPTRTARSEDPARKSPGSVPTQSLPSVPAQPSRVREPVAPSTGTIPGGAVAAESFYPRPAKTVLEVQVALARQVLSPGSIDGVMGGSTRKALAAFQEQSGLPVTGEWDEATRARLWLERPALKLRTVTDEDRRGLQPLHASWWGKSIQEALEHETLLERLAEQHHASPGLLQRLNPGTDWDGLEPGRTVWVPDVEYPPPRGTAARLLIRLGERWLRAYDAGGSLLAHFPCSVARSVEKRPVGRLYVAVVVERPNYTFNPEIFPDAPEAREPGRKLILPPGPNNPVGLAWIGLDRPGYGIHGTPSPERVGRPESRGCFRLTNWDALYLLRLVRVGTPVDVEP